MHDRNGTELKFGDDRNGTELKFGDLVVIPCKITELFEGNEDFCNVTLETLHGRRPDGQTETFCAVNTGQVILTNRPE